MGDFEGGCFSRVDVIFWGEGPGRFDAKLVLNA